MNINNLFSSLQPAVAKIQEQMQPFFKIQEQMQAFDKTFYKLPRQMLEFQKRFDSFPRQMLKTQKAMLSFSSLYNNEALIKLRQQLLGNGINSLSNVIGNNILLDKCALYDITGNNDLLGMSSPMINILKKYNNILGNSNILKSFDFKYTLGIYSIVSTQFKDLQNITQTFYGLQFSTTITRDGENETHAQCNITITQAEYTDIRNERDYYKEKAFYWQAEFNKENKERLQLQNKFSYIVTKSTHKEISSRGGKNSYQKYKPLKAKVEELCKITLQKNKNISALKLCNVVGNMIEKEHSEFLTNFKPYQDYLNANGTDWLKPTFYNWCLSVHKNTTQAK